MPQKISFVPRPIDSDYRVNWESLLIELSLAIICSIMAITGWNSGMAIMAYPASFVAVICIGLVINALVRFLIFKWKYK